MDLYLVAFGFALLGLIIGFVAGRSVNAFYEKWYREATDRLQKEPLQHRLDAEKAESEQSRLMELVAAIVRARGDLDASAWTGFGTLSRNVVLEEDLPWARGEKNGKEYFRMNKSSTPTQWGDYRNSKTTIYVTCRSQSDINAAKTLLEAQKAANETVKSKGAGI